MTIDRIEVAGLVERIKALCALAQPPDKSAPLHPICDLGMLVLANQDSIIAALSCIHPASSGEDEELAKRGIEFLEVEALEYEKANNYAFNTDRYHKEDTTMWLMAQAMRRIAALRRAGKEQKT